MKKPVWRSIETIPRGIWVEVETVTGLIRETRIPKHWTECRFWERNRLHCFSRAGGDLIAIKWRPKFEIVGNMA